MPLIDELTLKKQIREKTFSPVYMLYGNDVYLKQSYARKIAAKVSGKGADEFSVVKFSGKELELSDLENAISTMSFFGGDKCILISDYEADSAGAKTKEMKALLSGSLEGNVIVFWYDSVEVNLKKSAKFRAFAELINKVGCTVMLNHPEGSALIKLISDMTEKRGCRIHATTVKKLIDRSGHDLQTLTNEVEKLTSYVGSGEIMPEHIEMLCSKSVDTSVFSLAKYITSGNVEGAFSVLDDLFIQRVEPVIILSSLSGTYVDIYRAKVTASAGKRPQDVAKDFGYFGTEFRLRNAAPLASKMSFSAIRKCLEVLAKADGKLKSSRLDKRVIFEQTILQLAIIREEA